MNAVDALVRSVSDSPALPRVLDRLQAQMREEHRRRLEFYDWITPETKAEFINGEIVMHSPARDIRIVVSGRIYKLLDTFVELRGSGKVRHEKALCTFPRNDYEPDVVFFGPEKASRINDQTLRFPVPDLAVEVLSRSTEDRDRGVKFEDFAREGVAEYWIVDPERRTVEQYRGAGEGTYDLHARIDDGTIRSWTIEGFESDTAAFFDGDTYLERLRAILTT